MNTPQNPSEWAVQMGKIVISIIPTIRTFSYIFVPIRNSRFSSDSHFFVLFRTFSCTNGRQFLPYPPAPPHVLHISHSQECEVWSLLTTTDAANVGGGGGGATPSECRPPTPARSAR